MLDVWFASLGPVASALLEAAVRGAIRRTPPPPPQPKKAEPKLIEGYELVKPLGEGGIGTVWLVRKPGADRFFVLKIPKADALANATDTERAGILASFVEEAKALAGLYHPNVANIIDRGVSGDGAVPRARVPDRRRPQAVLVGAADDALRAAPGRARVVRGARGAPQRGPRASRHQAREPLAASPARRRREASTRRSTAIPALAPPLATVVIDFGMVRAIRVPAEAAGRFVAGTAGYIAPEQVLDPVELDPRSDVYALAGTIYNVTTGRAFFDDDREPARSHHRAHAA